MLFIYVFHQLLKIFKKIMEMEMEMEKAKEEIEVIYLIKFYLIVALRQYIFFYILGNKA